jgi:hypothetical protein
MAWMEFVAPAPAAPQPAASPAGSTGMVGTAGAAARTVALIDFDAAGGVDLDRLERSLDLRGERIGHGRYRVSGGSQTHWVDLYSTAHPRCDCGDHLWRERICKHILAALLREGNDRVVAALGRLLGRWRESGGPQPERKAA